MKGADDFILVLIAAVVLLVIFGLAGWYMTGGWGGPSPAVGNYTLLMNTSLGRVGFTGSSPIRTESIGSFIAGEPQVEALKSVAELSIATSLIGMEKREYTITVQEGLLPDVREAGISFNVEETNLYGDLVVKWNGMEVFRRKAQEGHYSVKLGRDVVKASNSLEVYAEGPGLMFWASTIYSLGDFRVNQVSGLAKIHSFSLSSSEWESFDKGVVSFSLGKRASGNLLIKVNGITVFNQGPGLEESIEFTFQDVPADILKAGNNNLVFSTEAGSFNIEDAELSIFVVRDVQKRARSFNMDSSMLGEFGVGTLELLVDIVKDGELEIAINGQALATPRIEDGLNRVIFGRDILQEGSNDIEFSGTGAFDISLVTLGYEK